MKPEEHNKTLKAWQTSSQYWEKYRDLIAQMFAPLTAALIQDAQIETSQKVLDIGGGSGEPSLTIAEIVGPSGSVLYTDPVAGMVQAAQTEANRRGLNNIQFRQCSSISYRSPTTHLMPSSAGCRQCFSQTLLPL